MFPVCLFYNMNKVYCSDVNESNLNKKALLPYFKQSFPEVTKRAYLRAVKQRICDRQLKLSHFIHTTAFKMQIPQDVIDKLDIVFSSDLLQISPHVNFSSSDPDRIELHISPLFLLEKQDFFPGSLLGETMNALYAKLPPSEKKENIKKCFVDINMNGNFCDAKKFVIYHELAHIANADLLFKKQCHRQKIEKSAKLKLKKDIEKRADLTAAHLSGLAESGLNMMQIFSKYFPSDLDHPSWEKRISYLRKYCADKETYLENQVNKKSRTLGFPSLITASPFSAPLISHDPLSLFVLVPLQT